MFDFFWVPGTSFLACVLAVLALHPGAATAGLVDRPDARKRHVGEVPLIGGIAITMAVWIGSLMYMRTQGYYVALLGGLSMLAVVGVMDDLRNIPAVPKLLAQIFAAILMTSWGGVYLMSLGDLFGRREIDLVNWGIPLTLFAVVAVANAMNMSDGIDGLCGGLAFVIFAWFAYVAGELGNGAAQRICVVFCGALLGFLIFNVRTPLRGKVRIFLGDAGSLMLGFAIAWFAVELSQARYNGGKHVPPVVMLWILGFILIDLLAVVLRRALKGRNPLSADRTHLHHILSRLGFWPNSIVWIIVASNAVMGLIGVLGWKMGVPDQWLFALFLVQSSLYILIMHNAWRFARFGRRVMRRK